MVEKNPKRPNELSKEGLHISLRITPPPQPCFFKLFLFFFACVCVCMWRVWVCMNWIYIFSIFTLKQVPHTQGSLPRYKEVFIYSTNKLILALNYRIC